MAPSPLSQQFSFQGNDTDYQYSSPVRETSSTLRVFRRHSSLTEQQDFSSPRYFENRPQLQLVCSLSDFAEPRIRIVVGHSHSQDTRTWDLPSSHPIFTASEFLAAYVSRWLSTDRCVYLSEENSFIFEKALQFVETSRTEPLYGLPLHGIIRYHVELYVLACRLLMDGLRTHLEEVLGFQFRCHSCHGFLSNEELAFLYCNTHPDDVLRDTVLRMIAASMCFAAPIDIIDHFKAALTEVPDLAADLMIIFFRLAITRVDVGFLDVVVPEWDICTVDEATEQIRKLLRFVTIQKCRYLGHVEEISTLEDSMRIR